MRYFYIFRNFQTIFPVAAPFYICTSDMRFRFLLNLVSISIAFFFIGVIPVDIESYLVHGFDFLHLLDD
jgi:hypothetical protein